MINGDHFHFVSVTVSERSTHPFSTIVLTTQVKEPMGQSYGFHLDVIPKVGSFKVAGLGCVNID